MLLMIPKPLVALGVFALAAILAVFELGFGARASSLESIGIAIGSLVETALLAAVAWALLRLAFGPRPVLEPVGFIFCLTAVMALVVAAIDLA